MYQNPVSPSLSNCDTAIIVELEATRQWLPDSDFPPELWNAFLDPPLDE